MCKYCIEACVNGSAAALVLILAIVVLPSSAANNSGLVVVPSKPSVLDLAGDWRLILLDDDNISREINLTLYQAEKEVFGWGNMTADNVTRRMVAVGSLEEDFLNLYLITEEADLMFRFTFKVGDDSMSGDYSGYSSDGEVISGIGSGYWYPPSGTSSGIGVKPEPTSLNFSFNELLSCVFGDNSEPISVNTSSENNTDSERTATNNSDLIAARSEDF